MKKIAMGLQPQMKQVEILLAHDLLFSDAVIGELSGSAPVLPSFATSPSQKSWGTNGRSI